MSLKNTSQASTPKNLVVTFHTTAEALAFRKACEQKKLPGRLTTIPRQITAGCGYAWTTPLQDAACIYEYLDAYDIEFEGTYEI